MISHDEKVILDQILKEIDDNIDEKDVVKILEVEYHPQYVLHWEGCYDGRYYWFEFKFDACDLVTMENPLYLARFFLDQLGAWKNMMGINKEPTSNPICKFCKQEIYKASNGWLSKDLVFPQYCRNDGLKGFSFNQKHEPLIKIE